MTDEYKQRTLERLYKQIRNTKWEEPEEFNSQARRGRKPKQFVKHESRPRTTGERQAATQGKYSWFDK